MREPKMNISFDSEAWESFQTTLHFLEGWTAYITPASGSPFFGVIEGVEPEGSKWEEGKHSAFAVVRKADSYGGPVGEPFTVIVNDIKII